jgi:hypothetical protein
MIRGLCKGTEWSEATLSVGLGTSVAKSGLL